MLDKDWVALPDLVKQRLLLLDPDVKYQLDLHYGQSLSSKQIRFKGSRWRMYGTLLRHTRLAWQSSTKSKYPNDLMYTVYGWGAYGFDVIYTGKVGYWRSEWDDYKYTYFFQLPDPPSYKSYHKIKKMEKILGDLHQSALARKVD